jgi:hypothetical protein
LSAHSGIVQDTPACFQENFRSKRLKCFSKEMARQRQKTFEKETW